MIQYKYGILDDAGKVVRWVFDKPSEAYQFIVVKIKRARKPKLDLSQFEAAPF